MNKPELEQKSKSFLETLYDFEEKYGCQVSKEVKKQQQSKPTTSAPTVDA